MTRSECIVQYIVTGLAVFILMVLYAPVMVGAMFSVVKVTRAGIDWHSATLGWYVQIWSNTSILDAIRTTLVVGVAAMTTSVVLSVVLALYVEWEGAIGRRIIEVIVYLPFLLPPIITGLSLLIFFAQFGISRGIATMAIGHSVFVLALLYRLVLARLKSLPCNLVEASADLGATRWQTFWLILWPLLRPVVLTGGILAFALSFDETLISVFLAGNNATLPLRLWAMMRVGFTPEINALVTLILITTIALAVVVGLRMKPDERDFE
jgi:ABC-type spermidine/putrescine transport system permease subunit II